MRWSCLQFNVFTVAGILPTSGRILENNTQSNAPPPPHSRLEVGVRQRLGGVTRVPQSSNPEPYELSCLVVVVHQRRLLFSVQVRGAIAYVMLTHDVSLCKRNPVALHINFHAERELEHPNTTFY